MSRSEGDSLAGAAEKAVGVAGERNHAAPARPARGEGATAARRGVSPSRRLTGRGSPGRTARSGRRGGAGSGGADDAPQPRRRRRISPRAGAACRRCAPTASTRPPPVRLPHALVDAGVADHGELPVLHRNVDEHAVRRAGPVHAVGARRSYRARHRVPGHVVEVDADLRRTSAPPPAVTAAATDVEVGPRDKPPEPSRGWRAITSLPLAPPPPKPIRRPR